MIHELRIYRGMPGRLPDLIKRFESVTLKLWDKHGFRPVGFWTTVIGQRQQREGLGPGNLHAGRLH